MLKIFKIKMSLVILLHYHLGHVTDENSTEVVEGTIF